MTFLEGMTEALASVHGPPPADMFKIVEKERRKLHSTNDPRPIKGNEREYLMLEIEEGIGSLKNALDKHFSQELMSGDNRIWNEKTQTKENVWKTPFIEGSCLPTVPCPPPPPSLILSCGRKWVIAQACALALAGLVTEYAWKSCISARLPTRPPLFDSDTFGLKRLSSQNFRCTCDPTLVTLIKSRAAAAGICPPDPLRK
jgi:hypothetical protein